MTIDYRRIYERHFGTIPKDSSGRTYDIHHIDGDRWNNSIENLVAVSIKEHYNIHYSQKDYAACLRIASKMKLSPEEISEVARKNALQRVANGTHPFKVPGMSRKVQQRRVANGSHNFLKRADGSSISSDQYKAGTHPFIGGEIQKQTTQKRLAAGTHNFQGLNSPSHKRVKEGTHNFQAEGYTERLVQKRRDNGTESFTNNNPAKKRCVCPHCSKEGSYPAMQRWHFDNCKDKQ